MSTFLQLVNRARRECGAASSDLLTLQSALVQDDVRFKDWINEAYIDVQRERPDWNFMRSSFEFPTVTGQVSYTPTQALAPDMADWKHDSFRASTAAANYADEQRLPFMEYGTWRNVYNFGNGRTAQGRPAVISIDPSKNLLVSPLCDQSYKVSGEYFRVPTDLSADADLPALPARFHMLLVWKACQSYGQYEAASEVMARGVREAGKIHAQLLFDQMPRLIFGPPLA